MIPISSPASHKDMSALELGKTSMSGSVANLAYSAQIFQGVGRSLQHIFPNLVAVSRPIEFVTPLHPPMAIMVIAEQTSLATPIHNYEEEKVHIAQDMQVKVNIDFYGRPSSKSAYDMATSYRLWVSDRKGIEWFQVHTDAITPLWVDNLELLPQQNKGSQPADAVRLVIVLHHIVTYALDQQGATSLLLASEVIS